jgi:CheY-like chemotaxis protein
MPMNRRSHFELHKSGVTTGRLPTLAPKVLLADPDIDSHLLYSHLLGLKAIEITHTTDGRNALVKALEYPFALIITETCVPFLDGYALCEILRHDGATTTTPIMVVTADARPASLERALRAGADVAFIKPVTDVMCSEAHRLILRSSELRDRSDPSALQFGSLLDTSQSGLRPGKLLKVSQSREHRRYDTAQPPIAPPNVICPSCDLPLTYELSYIGGVTARDSEQWDCYTCSGRCGRFEYRQRTRQLRHV